MEGSIGLAKTYLRLREPDLTREFAVADVRLVYVRGSRSTKIHRLYFLLFSRFLLLPDFYLGNTYQIVLVFLRFPSTPGHVRAKCVYPSFRLLPLLTSSSPPLKASRFCYPIGACSCTTNGYGTLRPGFSWCGGGTSCGRGTESRRRYCTENQAGLSAVPPIQQQQA